MRATATLVAVDQNLETLPAIESIVQNPGPDFRVTVCGRADMLAISADIVLLCADSDGSTVLEEIRTIRRITRPPKVLLMSTRTTGSYCEDAIVAGASGVLDRSASAPIALKALGCVARGELWLDRQTTGRVFERLSVSMTGKRPHPDDPLSPA